MTRSDIERLAEVTHSMMPDFRDSAPTDGMTVFASRDLERNASPMSASGR